MKTIIIVLACCMAISAMGEDADSVYREGLTKLQESQDDPGQLVQATKLLAKAADLFERQGDEAKVVAVNSCLYWARKKLTLADTESFKDNTSVAKRLESSAKPLPANAAAGLLTDAESFSRSHAGEPLLIAIRYFEIADRFPETPEGRKAMSASLAAMQKIVEHAKPVSYKPAASDGKAFITSDPPGAALFLVSDDGKKELPGKTPVLIQIPKGRQTLELRHAGQKPASLDVEVDEKAIVKPSAVKMQPLTIPMDIVFDEGWQVFVDGKPASSDAKTPCTIDTALGMHSIALAKENYLDITQKVDVKESGEKTLEIKTKPTHGTSALLKMAEKAKSTAEAELPKLIVGKFKVSVKGMNVTLVDEFLDNKVWKQDREPSGKWSVQKNKIVLDYKEKKYGTASIELKDNDTFTGKNIHENGEVYEFVMERIK